MTAITAAASSLDAPARATLARAVGRFSLADYREWLIECGLSSAKTVREATARALTGADGAALAAALDARYAAAPPVRAMLADLAFAVLAAGARPLLEAGERGNRTASDEAIARALVHLDLGEGDRGRNGSADTDGDVALDGTRVVPPPLPPHRAIDYPRPLFDLLRPAMAQYNAGWDEAHRTRPADQKWHWTLHQSKLGEPNLQAFKRELHGEATLAGKFDGLRQLDYGHSVTIDRSGLTRVLCLARSDRPASCDAFPGAQRLAGYLDSGAVEMGTGPPSGAVPSNRGGVDVRTVVALWNEAGGSIQSHDPV